MRCILLPFLRSGEEQTRDGARLKNSYSVMKIQHRQSITNVVILLRRSPPLLVRFRYTSYKHDASWGNPRADARASTRPQDGRRVRARFVAAPRPRHAPQKPASSRCRALRHGLVKGTSKQVVPNQRCVLSAMEFLDARRGARRGRQPPRRRRRVAELAVVS